MPKKKARILLATFMMLCLVISGMPVSAADSRIGEIVDGSVLTNETEAEYGEYSRARGTYLASGIGRIANLGGRQVRISGSTNCYRTSDEVRVSLTLQRLEGGSWVSTGLTATGTSYNSFEVSAGDTFSVSGGYYYRVYGSHTAKKGSTTETCTSYSNGIWVS